MWVPFWSVLPRAVRWRAAREVPIVVVAVFVVSSFCALCLVYLPFVCSRPCSCCCSERRVTNSVCSCHGCYTHIYPYWAMWPYRKVMYVHCAWVLYLVEKNQVLPWVDSVLCGVPRSLELLTLFSFSSFLLPLSLSLIITGIEEGTGDQCETVRNCTRRPRLAHLFSIHFLGPSPILLSLSFSFSGIEEGTCRFDVADSRKGLADVLALPIFSLFIFVLFLYFFFPLRQPSSRKLVFCHLFHSFFCLLFSLFL